MRRWSCRFSVHCHFSALACSVFYTHDSNCATSNMSDDQNNTKDNRQEATVSLQSTLSSSSSLSTTLLTTRTHSCMSGLLHMIANCKKTDAQTKTRRKKKTSSTSSGAGVLAGIFTSAASTLHSSSKQQKSRRSVTSEYVTVQKPNVKVSQKITGTTPAVVSPTLVHKLRRNVLCKRINWEQMLHQHPTLQRLPIWRQRFEWGTRFLSSSALPLKGGDNVTDIFLCSAPTGSGKSSLVPIFLLDSHWARLLQRIDASPGTHSGTHQVIDGILSSSSPAPFPTTGSSGDFVAEFGASSRVCIVVSQPTRLACVELAKFTAFLMTSSTSLTSTSSLTPSDMTHVGGRVGYAVGGDARFSPATEIIYATPGYIVNALQHKGDALSPTTLVIDEAHCRDMQTDLLLAWAKHQLRSGSKSNIRLRQLVLMSATLSVEQMVTLFTSNSVTENSGMLDEEERGTITTTTTLANERIQFTPHILLVESKEAQLSEIGDSSNSKTHLSPYRVEEYFIDDLPDSLETSHVLCRRTKNHSSSVLPLLDAPARRVMASLAHFFSYTRFGADIHTPQARALAQFLLFTLQSLAMTSTGSVASGEVMEQQRQPESILVFLPGFSEMSLVLQWLEILCRVATPKGTMGSQPSNTIKPNNDIENNAGGHKVNSEGVTFLQYEQWSFSVALLHATAIGSLQQQLRDTTGPFPHRIILSTAVAESSVTIPNVRCVVDSCLVRHFFTDPLTGVMLRCTTLASASSLRQRGGRTGRTCDGVVIHLAPRRIFGQSEKVDTTPQDGTHMPHRHVMTLTLGRGALSSLVAPAQTQPESVMTNAAAVLLRVKYLFPLCASALVQQLPTPPLPNAISCGVEQLMELGLLQSAGKDEDEDDSRINNYDNKDDNNVNHKEQLVVEEGEMNIPTAFHYYESSRLTAKGEFVVYFPIPHEQALLIYYALQFACVEEALLIACAMTVPSLLILPRITAQGDNAETETPAMQFLISLETQCKLAGNRKGENGNSSSHVDRSDCNLSEPLMLRSLLCEWYACSNNTDVMAFHKKYRVNRSALRLVDSCVAQCAARLHRLITFDDDEEINKNKNDLNNDRKELYGEYDTVTRRPSTQAIEQLIISAFPLEYRKLLASSLHRLHCCAMEHAAHRITQNSFTMVHWYPHDDQMIRVFQPLTNQKDKRRRRKSDNDDTAVKLMFGSVQQRLSAAFVAAFARNTMRGEDSAHRVHQKRLVRNLGALEEDVNNICSFNIELHTQRSTSSTQASLHDRLNVEELRRVLTPYLAGTHLRQLELFSNGKSAVACFGTKEKENELEKNRIAQQKQQCEEYLLAPRVLPFEQKVKPVRPTVTLAHIGISLLVSIQSTLTRLTVLLSPPSASNREKEEDIKSAKGDSYVNMGSTKLMKPNCRNGGKLATTATSGTHRAIYFSSVMTEEGHKPSNVCVNWYDNYGLKRSLLLSDVRNAGYEELFPIPSESLPLTAHIKEKMATSSVECNNDNKSEDSVHMAAAAVMRAGGLDYKEDERDKEDENVPLSIHRVVFTHALYWRLTLPTVRITQKGCPPSGKAASPSSSLSQSITPGTTLSGQECYYCWVCHSAWKQKDAFYAHCRSVTHLSRLAFTVQHRMRREWVSTFSSGTFSNLLLRQKDGGVGVELRHCSVSPTSFLNALQWNPRTEEAAATMPIAIAGSLVVNASNTTTVTPSYSSGSTLQALHVWVLDTDMAESISSKTTVGSHTVFPLPSSLFVLAGYLAATSSGFDVALLMNENHSRAYAVMLYDWGVWRLPAPLNRTQLQSLLDVFAGKIWRGVLFSNDDVNDNDDDGVSHGSGNTGDTGSLHWCVISNVCPQCTYSGSCGCAEMETKQSQTQWRLCCETLSSDEAVESTILLVLHEYRNSQRNVVSFADYIQRVVAKLDIWSAAQGRTQKLMGSTKHSNKQATPKKAATLAAAEWRGGAELLARFVARRRNQPLESLLRDIGCQFLSPPGALLQTGTKIPSSAVAADVFDTRNVSFSASAMAVEGVTTEKLFLLPSVLPSFLPSPDFAVQLRRHRRFMRHAAVGDVTITKLRRVGKISSKKRQQSPLQPSF